MPFTLKAAERSTGRPGPVLPVAALTTKVTVAVCVMLPEVPVIVTEAKPVAAALLAAKVIVLVVAVWGELNVAETPLGKPEAESLTIPLKPFTSLMVIVALSVEPWLTKTLLGAVMVNPGRATVM